MQSELQIELRRKLVHIVAGLFSMALPLLVTAPWQVEVVAIASFLALFGARLFASRNISWLYGVNRMSFGELLFPVAVALLYRFCEGDYRIYVTSIAVLTFADTAGAVVGKAYGRHHFTTNAGRKSIEGSLAVFLTTAFIVGIGMDFADPVAALLIICVIAAVITTAEGILGAGADNLVLPLLAFALLTVLPGLPLMDLLLRILVLTSISAMLLCFSRRSTLDGGGLLTALLFGYLSVALGELRFLLPPVILFAIHVACTQRHRDLRRLQHSAESVAAVALPALLWLAAYQAGYTSLDRSFHHFTYVIAVQAALLHVATRDHLQISRAPVDAVAKSAAVCIVSLPVILPACITAFIVAKYLPPIDRASQAILAFLLSLLLYIL